MIITRFPPLYLVEKLRNKGENSLFCLLIHLCTCELCVNLSIFENLHGKITNPDWLTQLVSAAMEGGRFLKKLSVASEGDIT